MAKSRSKSAKPQRTWRRVFLKEWLKRTGKSQTGLAEATGQSETIISLIANGRRRYNQDFLERAADYLGIQPSDLLHPPPEGGIWAAWNSLDEEGRKTVQDVLFAMRARERQ